VSLSSLCWRAVTDMMQAPACMLALYDCLRIHAMSGPEAPHSPFVFFWSRCAQWIQSGTSPPSQLVSRPLAFITSLCCMAATQTHTPRVGLQHLTVPGNSCLLVSQHLTFTTHPNFQGPASFSTDAKALSQRRSCLFHIHGGTNRAPLSQNRLL
jgi:hypothetical protein